MEYPSAYSFDMKKKYHNSCEECKYYHMIDSGYGWCTKNPPWYTIRKIKRVRFLSFRRVHYITYPCVPWDLRTCGNFELGNKPNE